MIGGQRNRMNYEDMVAMNDELITKNRLYSVQETGRTAAIAQTLEVIGNDVLKERKRLNLDDVESVKSVAKDYLRACQATPILPSKSGLSRALGYSRKGLYAYMKTHTGSETEEFLSQLFDAFSEAYDVSGMNGAIHPIYAIFVQKSQYEMRDNAPIDDVVENEPLGKQVSLTDIERKYEYLPED